MIISTRTGATDCDFPSPGFNSGDFNVSAVISDRHGGWFVGCCWPSEVEHLRSSGMPYASWHAPKRPNGSGGVDALYLFGNTLYVGGGFGVEALNASSGARFWVTTDTQNQESEPGGVGAIAATAGAVYVAGGFLTIDGAHEPSPIAALNPRTGSLLPWHGPTFTPAAQTLPPSFDGLILHGHALFVSSSQGVMVLDGKTRNALAAIDARTGALLPWHRQIHQSPMSAFYETTGLFSADGILFGAGMGQNTAGGAVQAATGRIVPGPWANVTAFTADGPIIYIGGGSPDGFSELDGEPRNNLAAFDLKTGRLTPWAPNVNRYSFITVMAVSGDHILAAGDFAQTLG